MLFKSDILNRIATGDITLAYRRWKRPTVKAGGQLKTAVGLLQIESVEVVDENSVTTVEASRAGFESIAVLMSSLRPEGKLYRIAFQRIGDDPRIALRENDQLTPDRLEELQIRLGRLDQRSSVGVWTMSVLHLIARHPELRAAELAKRSGFEKEWLKTNIRKLKNLGLTESLAVGYRLSPRGRAFLTAVEPGAMPSQNNAE